MKLILTLTTDRGDFITQVVVDTPTADLDLTDVEFSFRNCVANKALENLQAEAKLASAVKRFGGKLPEKGVC